eukprot:TRINITY_DN17600_c0_g1_i2.p1 TRINITY_DN17600_c0_g1~~TRINITY_DN17600_c0_g1_i2.p1  ORF type:complete len:1018 (+),score=227.25 TRINITY_DN17600_c0_g1_i2:90-3143(+)
MDRLHAVTASHRYSEGGYGYRRRSGGDRGSVGSDLRRNEAVTAGSRGTPGWAVSLAGGTGGANRQEHDWLRAQLAASRRENEALRRKTRGEALSAAPDEEARSGAPSPGPALSDRRSVGSVSTTPSQLRASVRERLEPTSLRQRYWGSADHTGGRSPGSLPAERQGRSLLSAPPSASADGEVQPVFDESGRYVPISLRRGAAGDAGSPTATPGAPRGRSPAAVPTSVATQPTRYERFIQRNRHLLDEEVVRDRGPAEQERLQAISEQSPAVAERFDPVAERFTCTSQSERRSEGRSDLGSACGSTRRQRWEPPAGWERARPASPLAAAARGDPPPPEVALGERRRGPSAAQLLRTGSAGSSLGAGDSPFVAAHDGEWRGHGVAIAGRSRVGGTLTAHLLPGADALAQLPAGEVFWLSGEHGAQTVVATACAEYSPTEEDLGLPVTVEVRFGPGGPAPLCAEAPPVCRLPWVEGLEVRGTPELGSALAATFEICGLGDSPPGDHAVQWRDAGTGAEVASGDVETCGVLRLRQADRGRLLEVHVTPVAGTGRRGVVGTPASAAARRPVRAAAPAVLALSLRCSAALPEPGCTVTCEARAEPLDALGPPQTVWTCDGELRQEGGTSYQLLDQDAGGRLECEYRAVNVDGEVSRPHRAELRVRRRPPQAPPAQSGARASPLNGRSPRRPPPSGGSGGDSAGSGSPPRAPPSSGRGRASSDSGSPGGPRAQEVSASPPPPGVLLGGVAGQESRLPRSSPGDPCEWAISAGDGTWTVLPHLRAESCVSGAGDVGMLLRCRSGMHSGAALLTMAPDVAEEVARAMEPAKGEGDSCKGFKVQLASTGATWFLMLTNRYIKLLSRDKSVEFKKRWVPELSIAPSGADERDLLLVAAEEGREFVLRCKTRAEAGVLLTTFRCFHALGMQSLCSALFGEDAYDQWKRGAAGSGVARRLRLPQDAHCLWLLDVADDRRRAAEGENTVLPTEVPTPECARLVLSWAAFGKSWLAARLAIASLVASLGVEC